MSEQLNKECPSCGGELRRVRNNSAYLNDEQFDSVKAGDWYCSTCRGDKGKSGFLYFWDDDLPGQPQQRVPCAGWKWNDSCSIWQIETPTFDVNVWIDQDGEADCAEVIMYSADGDACAIISTYDEPDVVKCQLKIEDALEQLAREILKGIGR
jgi:hypothetical protein